MRQVLASVAVSALALLTACGDDGGDEPLTGPAAQQAADRAVLAAEDLGEGWEQTGTAPPDETGRGIEECLSDDVSAASDDPVAESDTYEFTRGDSPTQRQQLQVSATVLEDEAAGRLVDELATAEVRGCLRDRFREEIGGGEATPGLEVDVGEFEADEGFGGAGDGATRLRAPMELTAEGMTLPATVDLVVVHTGQVVTAIVGFALGEPIAEEDLESWTERAAELQERQ
jgi:hypothetical protein